MIHDSEYYEKKAIKFAEQTPIPTEFENAKLAIQIAQMYATLAVAAATLETAME